MNIMFFKTRIPVGDENITETLFSSAIFHQIPGSGLMGVLHIKS